MQPSRFTEDRSKIAYICTHLTGHALTWATALLENRAEDCSDMDVFLQRMKLVLDHPVSGRDAANRLFHLRQGGHSVVEYSVEFRSLVVVSRWNSEALIPAFMNRLSESVKDELAAREEAKSLEDLISLAVRIDNRLRERRLLRREGGNQEGFFYTPSPCTTAQNPTFLAAEPMELGRSRIAATERERRIRERHCLYCGDQGHYRMNCPRLAGNDRARRE